MKLWLEPIHLDLRVLWKLSRNQTHFKKNFIVHLESDSDHFRSEIAPNIRYGETPESIQEQFVQWIQGTDLKNIKDQVSLSQALDRFKLMHSLRFGIESLFLSLFAKKQGQTLTKYLGLTPMKPVATSFSLPIMPVAEIASYLKPLSRFQSLKIKVDADSALDMLCEIKKHTRVKLRVDANEGWRDLDQFMGFQEKLKGMNIELIEQPFPANMHEEYKALKQKTPYKLLADESIEDVADFKDLAREFHAVNIKLMKTGSLLKARDLILLARHNGMESMIGCMIETSIGISYGMLFSGMVDYVDLDGFLLIKEEPFRLVQETEGILNLA